MKNSSDFIYSRHRCRGKLRPEYLEFNAELQEFSQRVYYICCLQTNGKLSSETAYKSLEALIQQLKYAKNQFDMNQVCSQDESDNSEA